MGLGQITVIKYITISLMRHLDIHYKWDKVYKEFHASSIDILLDGMQK